MRPPTNAPPATRNGSSVASASWRMAPPDGLRGMGLGSWFGWLMRGARSQPERPKDRIFRESQKLLRENSSGQCNGGSSRQRVLLGGGHYERQSRGLARVARFAGPHRRNDSEIVIHCRQNVERTGESQIRMAGFEQRPENQQLGDESGGGRQTGERQQKDQHQDRRGGVAVEQAVQVIDLVTDRFFLPQQDNHPKGSGVEKRVGENIERGGLQPALVQSAVAIYAGHQGEQNVSGLSNG